MELHALSVTELAEGLADKRFSSRELTEHYLRRIESHDQALNSYITVTAEQALAAADAADQQRAAG